MILANLTKAIREQNYYAVVLEFLIVIAGVVIGFQITTLNEERQAVAKAVVLKGRLIEDLRAEQWRVEATHAYYSQVSANARRAIATLEGRRDVDDETLVIEAFRATQIINFTVIRSTYDELVSTGDVSLINDEALIAGAVEYYDTALDQLTIQDQNRPYRWTFMRLTSPELYDEMAENCSEPVDFTIGDYDILPTVLEFPCDIEGHQRAIEELASRLRESPEILGLLRQRAIESSVEARNQLYWRNLLNTILPGDGEAQ